MFLNKKLYTRVQWSYVFGVLTVWHFFELEYLPFYQLSWVNVSAARIDSQRARLHLWRGARHSRLPRTQGEQEEQGLSEVNFLKACLRTLLIVSSDAPWLRETSFGLFRMPTFTRSSASYIYRLRFGIALLAVFNILLLSLAWPGFF